MCEYCAPPTPITRRRFLQLGAGAGIGVLLAACASEQDAPAGPAIPTMAGSLPPVANPAGLATVAGRVTVAGETDFVLAAPVFPRFQYIRICIFFKSQVFSRLSSPGCRGRRPTQVEY